MTSPADRIKRDIEVLDTRIAMAKKQRRKLRAELEQANTYPAAPTSDFIAFSLQFNLGGPFYRYSAVRAGTSWYTTSQKPESMRFNSWEQMVDWMRSAANAGNVVEMIGKAGSCIRV